MKKDFTLSDGTVLNIEIEDMLTEIFGEEWVEAKIAEIIKEKEDKLSKSQE